MMIKTNKIALFKDFSKDLGGGDYVSEYGYGVYIALRALYNVNYPISMITLNQIWYTLTGRVEKIPRRQKENLIKGIEELKEFGMEVKDESISDTYIIDMTIFYRDPPPKGEKDPTKYFETFELSTIQKIFNEGQFNILRYWLYIFGNIKEYYIVMSLDSIKEDLGFSKSTLAKYNKTFMELRVMYVNTREVKIIDENGYIKTVTNTYSLWKNKQITKDASSKYVDSLGTKAIYKVNKKEEKEDNIDDLFGNPNYDL